MPAKPFLLVRGELVQQSAASFGGNGDSDWVDHVLCRDGKQRCTLRGESLAGALTATARRLFKHLPEQIGDKNLKQPSVWRLFTSHPVEETDGEVRQNVRIHPQTGAAAAGALFDMETLPPNTRWPFLLEIDLARAGRNAETVVAVTLHALIAWTRGYCWLGRSVARGTGWFELQDVNVAEADWTQWPNSGIKDVWAYFDDTFKSQPLDAYVRTCCTQQPDGDWTWKAYRLKLGVRAPDKDDYGVDFVSAGGHSGSALLLDIHDDLYERKKLRLPGSSLKSDAIKNWVSDQTFAYTRLNGNIEPYLPGSSLRGVLRHAAEWWARKHGLNPAPLIQLFGDMAGKPKAGALLVGDARFAGEDCQALLLKMHAEDEFAGGVYEDALFDRLVLVRAKFEARLVIEARKAEMACLEQALKPVFKLAEHGFIGLGGQAWRGMGHLQWAIQSECEVSYHGEK